jgi:hypothetical protein
MVSGLLWSIIGIYDFTRSYSGDVDASTFTWAFGWVCLIMGIICWTSPLWLMKIIKEDKKEVVEDDYWEAKEKRMGRIRRNRKNIHRSSMNNWGRIA